MNKTIATVTLLGLVVALVLSLGEAIPSRGMGSQGLSGNNRGPVIGSGGSSRLAEQERFEQSGSVYDQVRDRLWAAQFSGERLVDSCMRGCLREEGLRRENQCIDICQYADVPLPANRG